MSNTRSAKYKFDNSDILKIIYEVRNRPCLWNKYDAKYKKNQSEQWAEIGEILDLYYNNVKKQWLLLRAVFAREFRKTQNVESKYVSKWKFYKNLTFISNQITFEDRKTKMDDTPIKNSNHEDDSSSSFTFAKKIKIERQVNSTVSNTKNGTLNLETSVDLNAKYQQEPLESNVLHRELQREEVTPKVGTVRKISGSNLTNIYKIENKPLLAELVRNYQKDLMKLENEKLKIITSLQHDDDMLFFKSLLPYVKSLKQTDKLELRYKIQKIIFSYMSDDC